MSNLTALFERSKKNIKRFSTAQVWITQCQDDGTIPTTAEWTLLPYITAPKIKTNVETSELRDGSNAVIHKDTRLTNYDVSFEMLQADKKTLTFGKAVKDNFYALAYRIGEIGAYIDSTGNPKDGIIQYQVFSPGQISMENEIDTGDYIKVSFTYSTLKNDVNVPITKLPKIKKKSTDTGFFELEDESIPAGDQMAIIEAEKTDADTD